eukprot:gene21934-3402_t
MDDVLAASGKADLVGCKAALRRHLRSPLAPALVAEVTALVEAEGGGDAAGSLACIQYFLECGACLDARKEEAVDVSIKDNSGHTAHHYASTRHPAECSPEILARLLPIPPAPALVAEVAALVEAGGGGDAAGSLACIQYFLECGACLDARKEEGGKTVLMIAAEAGRADAVGVMLEHWGRVDTEGDGEGGGGPD